MLIQPVGQLLHCLAGLPKCGRQPLASVLNGLPTAGVGPARVRLQSQRGSVSWVHLCPVQLHVAAQPLSEVLSQCTEQVSLLDGAGDQSLSLRIPHLVAHPDQHSPAGSPVQQSVDQVGDALPGDLIGGRIGGRIFQVVSLVHDHASERQPGLLPLLGEQQGVVHHHHVRLLCPLISETMKARFTCRAALAGTLPLLSPQALAQPGQCREGIERPVTQLVQ